MAFGDELAGHLAASGLPHTLDEGISKRCDLLDAGHLSGIGKPPIVGNPAGWERDWNPKGRGPKQ
jgi:hypothetical protein